MQATSRWAVLFTRRVGGKQVKTRGLEQGTTTDGEAVGKRGKQMIQRRVEEKVGSEGLVYKCNDK